MHANGRVLSRQDEAASAAVREVPVLRRTAAFLLLVQTAYSCLFAVVVVEVLRSSDSTTGGTVSLVLVFLAYAWASRVLRAVLSFVAAGVMSIWLTGGRLGGGGGGVGDFDGARRSGSPRRGNVRSRSFSSGDDDDGGGDDDREQQRGGGDLGSRDGGRGGGMSSAAAAEVFVTRAFTTSAGTLCAGALCAGLGELLWSWLAVVRHVEMAVGLAGCCRGGRQRHAPPDCASGAVERYVQAPHTSPASREGRAAAAAAGSSTRLLKHPEARAACAPAVPAPSQPCPEKRARASAPDGTLTPRWSPHAGTGRTGTPGPSRR